MIFQPYLYYFVDADDLSITSERDSFENQAVERSHQDKNFIEVELKFLTEEEKKLREQNLPVGRFNTSKWTLLSKLKSSICCFCD